MTKNEFKRIVKENKFIKKSFAMYKGNIGDGTLVLYYDKGIKAYRVFFREMNYIDRYREFENEDDAYTYLWEDLFGGMSMLEFSRKEYENTKRNKRKCFK